MAIFQQGIIVFYVEFSKHLCLFNRKSRKERKVAFRFNALPPTTAKRLCLLYQDFPIGLIKIFQNRKSRFLNRKSGFLVSTSGLCIRKSELFRRKHTTAADPGQDKKSHCVALLEEVVALQFPFQPDGVQAEVFRDEKLTSGALAAKFVIFRIKISRF